MAATPPIRAKISGFSTVFDVYEIPGADFPIALYFHEEGDVPPPNARRMFSGLREGDILGYSAIATDEIRTLATRVFPDQHPFYAHYLLWDEAHSRAQKHRHYAGAMDVTTTVSRLDALEQIHFIRENVTHPGARRLMDAMLNYPLLQIRAVPGQITLTDAQGNADKFGGVAWYGVQPDGMHHVDMYIAALAQKNNNAIGLLMEELTHKAIEIVFGNQAMPFKKNDALSKRAFFNDLRDDIRDWWKEPAPKERRERFPTISAELRYDLALGDPTDPKDGYSFADYRAEIPAKMIAMMAAGMWDQEMQWKYPRTGRRLDALMELLAVEMENSVSASLEKSDLQLLHQQQSGKANSAHL